MNVVELREILQRNHVPDNLYQLPGMVSNNDCYGLQRQNDRWLISYWERGMPYSEETFATEQQGCERLWERMKQSVKWPIALDAQPLSPPMAAFIDSIDRQSEVFTSRKLALWYKGFYVRGDEKLGLLQVPYLFLFRNWNLKLDLMLSFADSPNQGDRLSCTLCNFSGKQIQMKDLLAAGAFNADAVLFEYPQATLPCKEHLARLIAALKRAFDGVLKPALEGALLNSIEGV